MDKGWYKKREVAHWILTQLFKDSIEPFGTPLLLHKNGKILVERSGKVYQFDGTSLRIQHLLESTSKYSLSEIVDALSLLSNNDHVAITYNPGKEINNALIGSNGAGVIAYQDHYYLHQIEEREKDWPKRNWRIVAVSTYLIGVFTTILTGKLQSKPQVPTKGVSIEKSEAKQDSAQHK